MSLLKIPGVLKDYTYIKLIQDEYSMTVIVEKENIQYCLKAKHLHYSGMECNNFEDEVKIYRHMSDLGIAPKFIQYYIVEDIYGVMVTELYDYTYMSTLRKGMREEEIRNPDIDTLIQTMHAAGVVHGDLHSYNIMIKDTLEGPKYGIIDFGNAFYIANVSVDHLFCICSLFHDQKPSVDNAIHLDTIHYLRYF